MTDDLVYRLNNIALFSYGAYKSTDNMAFSFINERIKKLIEEIEELKSNKDINNG